MANTESEDRKHEGAEAAEKSETATPDEPKDGKVDDKADGEVDDEAQDGEDDEDDEGDEGDEDESAAADDDPLDLESRVLCPDGNCIGVIGPDGRCKECGMALPEAERKAVVAVAEKAGRAPVEEKPAPRHEADDDALDFSKRRLCSDGSCIGVIGPDGRCKECGKPYQGEPE